MKRKTKNPIRDESYVDPTNFKISFVPHRVNQLQIPNKKKLNTVGIRLNIEHSSKLCIN